MSYNSTNTNFAQIKEFDVCKTVSTPGYSLFIPTKTSRERTWFIANKPSDVALGECWCTTPWWTTINDGDSVTAYSTSTVVCWSTCISETRTCNGWILWGSYTYQNCSVSSCSSSSAWSEWASCTVLNYATNEVETIPDGQWLFMGPWHYDDSRSYLMPDDTIVPEEWWNPPLIKFPCDSAWASQTAGLPIGYSCAPPVCSCGLSASCQDGVIVYNTDWHSAQLNCLDYHPQFNDNPLAYAPLVMWRCTY